MKIRENLRKLTEAELAEYSTEVEAAYQIANNANNEARRAADAAFKEWTKWVYAAEAIGAEKARREKKLRKDSKPMHGFTHMRENRSGGWGSLISTCACGNWKVTIASSDRSADEGWAEIRKDEVIHLKYAKAQDEAHVEDLVENA